MVRAGTLVTSDSNSVDPSTPTTPENSYNIADKMLMSKTKSQVNWNPSRDAVTMSSEVSVPVLSKQQMST